MAGLINVVPEDSKQFAANPVLCFCKINCDGFSSFNVIGQHIDCAIVAVEFDDVAVLNFGNRATVRRNDGPKARSIPVHTMRTA